MFQYKGKPVDIVTFAKQFNADYVVEGSVRRQAASIRISAQLLDGHTGGHVWSESDSTSFFLSNSSSSISLKLAHRAVTYCLMGDLAKGDDLIRQTLEIKPDFNETFWKDEFLQSASGFEGSGRSVSRRRGQVRLGSHQRGRHVDLAISDRAGPPARPVELDEGPVFTIRKLRGPLP